MLDQVMIRLSCKSVVAQQRLEKDGNGDEMRWGRGVARQTDKLVLSYDGMDRSRV